MKHTKIFLISAFSVVLFLLVMAVPAVPVHAATLTLTPACAAPGTLVTVTGSGLWPNHALKLFIEETEILETSTTNSGTIRDDTYFFVSSDFDNGTYEVSLTSYGNFLDTPRSTGI